MYYAHSVPGASESFWEKAEDHLIATARKTAEFASKFNAYGIGYAAGLWHDLGKLHPSFQARLRGSSVPFDHSCFGAAHAMRCNPEAAGRMLSFVIAGHHVGLADGRRGKSTRRKPLMERVAIDGLELEKVVSEARKNRVQCDLNLVPPEGIHPASDETWAFTGMFFTRMLFSCLVDADCLSTEEFYQTYSMSRSTRGGYPCIADLKDELDRYMSRMQAQAAPSFVNNVRRRVRDDCLAAAEGLPGLYTLTVPTGGGKTLSSLSFALTHAVKHRMDRVIIVVPFTSVIEQTADVIRNALGQKFADAVIEHHSAFDSASVDPEGSEKLRLATENWDAPIIVTTSVQFFESLFASRASQCRKLHNICRSVVTVDEAQALPLHLLTPTFLSIDELVRNYGCTVVLSTATQPAVGEMKSAMKLNIMTAREIVSDPVSLFRSLRRTEVSHTGMLDDAEAAERMVQRSHALVIVNTRRHARLLYSRIRHLEGSYHLSTWMCAEHRSDVIGRIKERLAAGLPCRVVSTPLIEAGVDIDFPYVLRADAGLDQIAQAAGRCNREGMLGSLGIVEVFTPSDRRNMLPEMAPNVDAARGVLWNLKDGGSLLEPAAVREFFRRLYAAREGDGRSGTALDKYRILDQIIAGGFDFPFETVSRLYRMIREDGVPLIVPYGTMDVQAAEEMVSRLRPGDAARVFQRHAVNVSATQMEELLGKGSVRHLDPERQQFPFLVAGELYGETGLLTDLDESYYLS